MGRSDEVTEAEERRRDLEDFQEGANHKCSTCGHNSFEHSTGPIDTDKMSQLAEAGTDEEWVMFWSMPTPCIFCDCGHPDIANQFMVIHHDCPRPCKCPDFTE